MLWLIVLIIVVLAVVGGLAVNPVLWALLAFALGVAVAGHARRVP